MPDYLFDSNLKIFETIDKTDEVLLFLDYDGTLVYFKDQPHEVDTSHEVKTVLKRLIQNPKFTVFIVSGRPLHEIKNLIDIEGISFAALHGLHIECSDGRKFSWKPSEDARFFLEKIKENAFSEFNEEKGICIEDKEFTLAFHYRMLPTKKTKYATERFMKIVKRIDEKNVLEIIKGAKVIEVRPKGWNKGKAIEFFLRNIDECEHAIPIYIGDDTTDEDAFVYLKNRGLTIFVSNDSKRSTSAQYWLKNPDEVLVFLKSFLDIETRV